MNKHNRSILNPLMLSCIRLMLRRIYHHWGTTGQHWARVVMDEATGKIIQNISPHNLSALEISGNRWQNYGFLSYKHAFFPDFDLCYSKTDETFDLIIAEQVFEHLLWPYRAGINAYKMLNNRGYFLITTPFLMRIHNHPTDCTRWTETGIRHFLAECGFDYETIHTGSWGNRKCVRKNLSRWVPYRPYIHSLKNEPDFPVVVWALAQKHLSNGDSPFLNIQRPQVRTQKYCAI